MSGNDLSTIIIHGLMKLTWVILWTCFMFFSFPPTSTALHFFKEERLRMIILCLEPQTWISHYYIIILLSKIMNHTIFPNSLYFWVILCLKNYSYDSTFSLLHVNILWMYKQCRVLNFYPFQGFFFFFLNYWDLKSM